MEEEGTAVHAGPRPMGRDNCSFEIDMEKDPLVGGDVRESKFGSETARDGAVEDEDEGLELFREWCEDAKRVWDAGWTLEPDGPFVATLDAGAWR